MVHNLSGFCFICFHYSCFWQKGGGRQRGSNPSFSALLFSFFPQQGVYCHVIPHRFSLATRQKGVYCHVISHRFCLATRQQGVYCHVISHRFSLATRQQGVYCHVISHRFSLATRNHDCSELPSCLHIEPDSIERINAEFGYLITANHGLVIKEYSKAARS